MWNNPFTYMGILTFFVSIYFCIGIFIPLDNYCKLCNMDEKQLSERNIKREGDNMIFHIGESSFTRNCYLINQECKEKRSEYIKTFFILFIFATFLIIMSPILNIIVERDIIIDRTEIINNKEN